MQLNLSTTDGVVPVARDKDGQFLVVYAERNSDWVIITTTSWYHSVYDAKIAWDSLYMAFRLLPLHTAWLLTSRPDTNRIELELLQREFGTLSTANLSSTRPLRGEYLPAPAAV